MITPAITVLLVNPYEAPQTIEIPADLSAYQQLVGGTIQEIYPSIDDLIALICNDEGKLLGLPLNRPLFDEDVTCTISLQVPFSLSDCRTTILHPSHRS